MIFFNFFCCFLFFRLLSPFSFHPTKHLFLFPLSVFPSLTHLVSMAQVACWSSRRKCPLEIYLRKARTEGLTLREIAEKYELSPATVYRKLAGKNKKIGRLLLLTSSQEFRLEKWLYECMEKNTPQTITQVLEKVSF